MARTTPTRRGLTAREQFWLGDLRKIDAAGIETKAYAERRGLSVDALYQGKRSTNPVTNWDWQAEDWRADSA